MATLGIGGNAEHQAIQGISLSSVPVMKELFRSWLADNKAKKYSLEVILSCLDKISDYAIRKRISVISIWDYTQVSAFKLLYNKILETKLLRVTDRKTYKVFVVAGQLYLQLLKDKPLATKIDVMVADAIQEESSDNAPDAVTIINISPEALSAWLLTQPNANGTLYLENVVCQYISALRTAPAKLEMVDRVEICDVFACATPSELRNCWEAFKATANYKSVNLSTSGSFSAGMGCLLRYLEHLANNGSSEPTVHNLSPTIKRWTYNYGEN